jgi:DNA polymerase-3 subunit delta
VVNARVATNGFDPATILRNAAIRVVLFHGADEGLIRARGRATVAAIAGDLADPFRVTELAPKLVADDPVRVNDEMNSQSLTGGRRAVWLRNAPDAATAKAIEGFLDQSGRPPAGDSVLVVEAGSLDKRSLLRALLERASWAAVVACYPLSADELRRMISGVMATHKLRISEDALAYLVEHLGADQQMSVQELEKLTLYKASQESDQITLEDAQLSTNDAAAISLTDAVAAAAEGRGRDLVRALDRVFQEGENGVRMVRVLIDHMQRLLQILRNQEAGVPPAQTVQALRPPAYKRDAERLISQARMWSTARAASAADRLLEAEIRCKSTGFPAEVIAGQAFLEIALIAQTVSRETRARR